jgi:protein-tyrosine-phosphatase
VYSAGLHANPIHPLTIQVMEEPGCDLSKHTSKKFSQYLGKAHFDISITVYDKAREECLMLPSLGIRLD